MEGTRNSFVSYVSFTGNSMFVIYGKTKVSEALNNITQADWCAFLKDNNKSKYMVTLVESLHEDSSSCPRSNCGYIRSFFSFRVPTSISSLCHF